MDVIGRVPRLGVRAVAVRHAMADARTRHHAWIREHGIDMPASAAAGGRMTGGFGRTRG
jgi:xylulose-5-phosphate/fructose-6-phosphate phosphoketolase